MEKNGVSYKNYVHFIIGVFVLVLGLYFAVHYLLFSALCLTFTMVYWWITQPVPLYLTALLPILVGPMSGVISDTELAQAYGNKMIFLFLGGFILAIGIEKQKLHRYFAELIIDKIGNTPFKIMLGFVLTTAFLSMWISNTATALMMLPMALAVNQSIPRFREKKRFTIALLLSIAYAANIGGIATLIGTPPNVQMAGIMAESYDYTIQFFDWFIFAFPLMLSLLLVLVSVLYFLFLRKIHFEVSIPKHKKLNSAQKRVLSVFSIVVFLWVFAQPIQSIFDLKFSDTAVAILGAFLLFIVPENKKQHKALLVWEDLKRMPWGILFLFGGGLALAKILSNAEAIAYGVSILTSFTGVTVFLLFLIIFFLVVFSTELMSNLALVSLVIPLMAEFAIVNDLPVFGIVSGIAISSSCAFMLPVATPPNAIVFGANVIPISTMMKVGLVLNVFSVLLITVAVYLFSI